MLIKHLKEENDLLKQKLGIPLDAHDEIAVGVGQDGVSK
jgi:hypothetical protein